MLAVHHTRCCKSSMNTMIWSDLISDIRLFIALANLLAQICIAVCSSDSHVANLLNNRYELQLMLRVSRVYLAQAKEKIRRSWTVLWQFWTLVGAFLDVPAFKRIPFRFLNIPCLKIQEITFPSTEVKHTCMFLAEISCFTPSKICHFNFCWNMCEDLM